MRQLFALCMLGAGLLIPLERMSADSEIHSRLSAEWWQWVLSIPTPVNPMLDVTGENCMVGQHGPVWFLAGFFPGGTGTRTCSVPDDKALFFPVVNSINFNTPNVCGQGASNMAVRELRRLSADFMAGVTNVSAELDGKPIEYARRIRSEVFAVALPEDNVFDRPCQSLSDVPAGIYSPAVDDGLYVLLGPIEAGTHSLHFHAENASQGFTQDVTYTLRVVHVAARHRKQEQ
jgi:hypothetical protein